MYWDRNSVHNSMLILDHSKNIQVKMLPSPQCTFSGCRSWSLGVKTCLCLNALVCNALLGWKYKDLNVKMYWDRSCVHQAPNRKPIPRCQKSKSIRKTQEKSHNPTISVQVQISRWFHLAERFVERQKAWQRQNARPNLAVGSHISLKWY